MRRWLIPILLLVAGGCASTRAPLPQDEAERLQATRESRVLSYGDWALRGRIAVSDGEEGGSARVNWESDDSGYELWIYAPLAQGTWRLHGDSSGAVLEGSGGTYRARDASSLLVRHLGWHLPVDAMRHWARGVRDPGPPARVSYDARGRPSVIRQSGWTVRYTDWAEYPELVMPRRIEAESPPYTVKLVIQDWALRGPGRVSAQKG